MARDTPDRPDGPPVDDPSGQVRFLSRADLGEEIAPHPRPAAAELPFAVRGDSGVPFSGKAAGGSDWGLDQIDGVPPGLPRLLSPEPKPAPEAAAAPPALDTAVEPKHAPTGDATSDVFALGGEDDDHSEDISADESLSSALPEASISEDLAAMNDAAMSLAPMVPPDSGDALPNPELDALRARVAELEARVWLFGLGGLALGLAAGWALLP